MFMYEVFMADLCKGECIHATSVERARKNLPSEELCLRLVNFFKIFGDQTRIKILSALSCGEMCVCDIASLLEMNQSAVSHQLRMLKQEYLVKFRKEGKTVYYSLEDEHIRQIFEIGTEHVKERKI